MTSIFPHEIVRLISIFLPSYALSVSKYTNQMYDEHWFRDKLTLLYPRLNLCTHWTYKELYKRSLETYQFHKENFYTKTSYYRGIKVWSRREVTHCMLHLDISPGTYVGDGNKIASCNSNFNNLILTFNGDLYHSTWDEINTQFISNLINTNVVDVDSFTYVTLEGNRYVWYIYSNADNSSTKVSTFTNFKSITCTSAESIYSTGTHVTRLPHSEIYKLTTHQPANFADFSISCQKIVNSTFGATFLCGNQVTIKTPNGKKINKNAIDIFPNIIQEKSGFTIYEMLNGYGFGPGPAVVTSIREPNVKSSVTFQEYIIVLTDDKVMLYHSENRRGAQCRQTCNKPQGLVNLFGNDHGCFYGVRRR
jgi:hypothetical protein